MFRFFIFLMGLRMMSLSYEESDITKNRIVFYCKTDGSKGNQCYKNRKRNKNQKKTLRSLVK